MSFNIRATHIQISIVSRCLVVHCAAYRGPEPLPWEVGMTFYFCLAVRPPGACQFLEDRPRSANGLSCVGALAGGAAYWLSPPRPREGRERACSQLSRAFQGLLASHSGIQAPLGLDLDNESGILLELHRRLP